MLHIAICQIEELMDVAKENRSPQKHEFYTKVTATALASQFLSLEKQKEFFLRKSENFYLEKAKKFLFLSNICKQNFLSNVCK